MNDSQIFKQLEFYSNAIVAFVVIQSLTFCYNFGENSGFKEILKTKDCFSWIIATATLLIMVLSLYANNYINLKLQNVADGHGDIIKKIYLGKAIVIIIFSLLQIYIIVRFGIFGEV